MALLTLHHTVLLSCCFHWQAALCSPVSYCVAGVLVLDWLDGALLHETLILYGGVCFCVLVFG